MRVGRSISRLGRLCFLLVSFAPCLPLRAQTEPSTTKPYASLDRESVTYRGPVSTARREVPGDSAVIGLILALRGQQASEGKALLAAAQIALDEEKERGALPDGRRLSLAVRDESGQWGKASSEILRLIDQDHALVLLTSANGTTAHQAEQIANKISFPILTLASDPTTTQTNVPWLFRLGPSDADQARAFCQRISSQAELRKILLIAEMDHDGRVGSEEFEKAAREMKLAEPEKLEISSSEEQPEQVRVAIREKKPDAIVVWTDGLLASRVLEIVRTTAPKTPVFLCSKAAQLGGLTERGNGSASDGKGSEAFAAVGSREQAQQMSRDKFAELYEERTGNAAGFGLFEMYEAVHLVADGIRKVGANRELLREYFASAERVQSSTGILPFDPAGNSRQEFGVIKIATADISSTHP
jgi:branched-chain amino acid transport system substrate-binding protein